MPQLPDRRRLSQFTPRRDLATLYDKHFYDPTQERRMLCTVGFLGAFGTARGVTHAIRSGKGPFGNISAGGHHIHHMTFGIIGMLLTGYLWVNQVGTGHNPRQRRSSRATAAAFGAGAALTLDEFALWLNLEDDYWTKKGRESIDAVAVFACLLVLALMWRDLLTELASTSLAPKSVRRRARRRRLVRYRARRFAELARDPGRLRAWVR